jgi:hypothetical protein
MRLLGGGVGRWGHFARRARHSTKALCGVISRHYRSSVVTLIYQGELSHSNISKGDKMGIWKLLTSTRAFLST